MSTRYWTLIVLALFGLTIGCSKPSSEPPEGVDTATPDLDISVGTETPAADAGAGMEMEGAKTDTNTDATIDEKTSMEANKETKNPEASQPELNPPAQPEAQKDAPE